MGLMGLRDKFEFTAEAIKAKREGRLIRFAEIPYIKELLPKRRLTGAELGILKLTDQCQRVCQERKGLDIVPLVTDTKYRLLRRKVDEVPTYKDEYDEYRLAADILYIQERWARSVGEALLIKLKALSRTLELVEVAETHSQRLKKNKGPINYYDKDLEYTEYTLKNIVDDRPEAALPCLSGCNIRDIQRDLYFINGFNKYLEKIGDKLQVVALNALRLDVSGVEQLIESYNNGLNNFKRYLIKNKRSGRELDILEDIFPLIDYKLKENKRNIKAVLMAEDIIDKHNVFTGGFALTVFYFFTDDEAGQAI